ncbi:uncharacterized protein LOC18793550 [Prunus persica]|uniref:uncharacterized protein LOC18793550 n=1 Tax=Prunus persica TaxID=3760 RepID=UPI0009AB9713|nr:uncharacterized protein LOC18793550 [Prunus persica]
MSLLSWNCRGLGNPRTVQDLRRLVVAKDPMVVFLCETRCKQRNFNSIKEQLGFDYCFVVDAIGLSGGLCLFWKSELNLAIRSSSTHHIDAEVGGIGDSLHWRLTGFYGYPATEDTHLSWNLLRDLASESRLPWVCMGDFNELLYANEKEGGLIRPVRQMLAFRDAISDCHLDDMGFEGATFTWFSTRNGGIKERLDRAHSCTKCVRRLKPPGIQLMQWQRSMFGTTKAEIQRVRSQLDVVWRQPNSENTTATYHLLMSQLDSLLSREEAFWKQRSKVSWLKEGDRNTRFFHQRASNRKQRNYVKGLRDNTGRWREDEQGLQYVVLDYFTHLFTSSASGSEGESIDAVESRVTPDMNNLLLTDYCDAEIHEAVFQMYPTKAPEQWIQLMLTCISTVSYSFVINGTPHGFLHPSRGLHQGDPLSPYLFLLCAEGLTELIAQKEREGFLKGVSICRGAPAISHLFFADDSVLFARANMADCMVLKDILDTY